MLMNEKQAIKALPRVQAAAEFDMNEGIVSVSSSSPSGKKGAKDAKNVGGISGAGGKSMEMN